MKKLFPILLALALVPEAHADTTVFFNLTNFTSRANNRKINVRLRSQGAGAGLNPAFGMPRQLQPTNSVVTNRFQAAVYLVDIDGITKTWVMPVPDSTNIYNAFDLINAGLEMDEKMPALAAGDNIAIDTNYVAGFPVLTINGAAGNGSGNVIGIGSSTIGHIATYSATDAKHIVDGGALGTAAFANTNRFLATNAQLMFDTDSDTPNVHLTNGASGMILFDSPISGSVSMVGELTVGDLVANSTSTFNSDVQVNGVINGNGSGLTHLNGSQIDSGTVSYTRLGSGGDGSGTHYFADDNSFKSIPGGGDMLKSDNLSGLANNATARANIGVAALSITLTNTGDGNLNNHGYTNASQLGAGNWYIKTNQYGLLFTNPVLGAGIILSNGLMTVNGKTNATTDQLLPTSNLSAVPGFAYLDANTNLSPTWNGASLTNTIPWTHEGTTTNITATFNGSIQMFTCTNGPSIGQDYFFHYAGANGSISYRFSGSSYNNLHFDYQPKWLTGSNSTITNGVLSLTSYGGTNAAQIEAAMRENQ
jgi:hypothetical protein